MEPLRSGSVSAKPTLRERKAWPFGLSFRAYAMARRARQRRLAQRATLRDRIL
ncbi:MAG: hypothetical protein F6K65_05040 [Moorea sp. SIO3C2]|nr:hypothetical protein [Moorena sp. SIO3C2]